MKETSNDICYTGGLINPVIASIQAIYPLGTPVELTRTFITEHTRILFNSDGLFSDYTKMNSTRKNYIIKWAQEAGLLLYAEVFHVKGNRATSLSQGELFRNRTQADTYARHTHSTVSARRAYTTTKYYEDLVGLQTPLYDADAVLSVYLHYRNMEGRIHGVFLPQFSNTAILFYAKQLLWQEMPDMATCLLHKMRHNETYIAENDDIYTLRLERLSALKTPMRHEDTQYFIEHLGHDVFVIVGCGQMCIYDHGKYRIDTVVRTSFKKMLNQLTKYPVKYVTELIYQQLIW